jgi:hypothetical protein
MVLLDDGWEVIVSLVRLRGSRLMLVALLTFSRLLWWRTRGLLGVQL